MKKRYPQMEVPLHLVFLKRGARTSTVGQGDRSIVPRNMQIFSMIYSFIEQRDDSTDQTGIQERLKDLELPFHMDENLGA